jgi:hypothetical protein
MFFFGKDDRAPAERPLSPLFLALAKAAHGSLTWLTGGCSHRNASWPTNGKQTCHDCHKVRAYQFTDTGIRIGYWRAPLPDSNPRPTWDYIQEAIAPSVRNNPVDILAARERNRADLIPSTCPTHNKRLDHFGQCPECVAALDAEAAKARTYSTEYRRVVDAAIRVTDRHYPKSSRSEVRTSPCPECGAKSGEHCIGARDKARTANHQGRINAHRSAVPA